MKFLLEKQRAEHLKHAIHMASANDTIAEEGESRLRKLIKNFFV